MNKIQYYDEQHPGFKHFFIQPHFVNGLDLVDAEYSSINGLIKSSWKRNGNEITLEPVLPD
ncbi:alpha-L-rhamnosidase C-terminal domain-containing protein [Bacteroides zhangwenhongii]|uniref:alpha-L-rhamnosidase C-terminal domain-containing protein n=1 Tax=Bacteroides zhangwenhongii TaxID=2650157 RepID=UPI00300E87FE